MGNRITTREGFVSDKLVNLGKRLQVNYDLKTQPAPEHETKTEPSVPASAPVSVAEAPRAKLAERIAAVERSEAERMHRELTDRIGHDSAAVAAELESCAAVQEELSRYREFLEHAASELESIDPASPAAIRRIEEIRYRCFTANGRAQTFFGGKFHTAASTERPFAEYKSFGAAMRESLPLILAVIISALIVGAAVLLALH